MIRRHQHRALALGLILAARRAGDRAFVVYASLERLKEGPRRTPGC